MPLTAKAALSKDKQSGKGVKLQHRHFAFIASVIRGGFGVAERKRIAEVFASELQVTNPNFDWNRFILAAGGGGAIPEDVYGYPVIDAGGTKWETDRSDFHGSGIPGKGKSETVKD